MQKFFSFLALSGFLWAGSIPEPMFFDLIRPLDSKQGELEINTLAHKSFDAKNTNKSIDPFGSGQTTIDREKIEWAPEIEYAVADGFALEFELPFEGAHLEAYKFGAQYTFGKPFEGYIHGTQILLETTDEWEKYNTTLLYLGGYRFDKTFSTLFMLGGRLDLEGENRSQSFEYLANMSLFANITHRFIAGIESNYSRDKESNYALAIIPQIHYEVSDKIEVQAGVSFGEATFARKKAFVLRAVYCF